LIDHLITEWAIPFTLPNIIASGLAAYINKYKAQINTCGAYIIKLISNAWTLLSSFNIVKQLLAAIKKSFTYTKA
ncbi:4442_t:CDS:2, partial [Gigaspora rosea]